MNPRTDLWLQNLIDERDGAALYEGLAKYEKDAARATSFRELAEAERRHAAIWARKLEKEGVALPADLPSSRVRALVWLARRLGSAAVVPMILETEAGDAEKYDQQGGEATAIAEEERAHGRVLTGMAGRGSTSPRGLIASRERWHRGGGRAGSIRAAIFGMNDGLVSNLSLILGVAGAGVAPGTVLVTGFAGLLAGAFSMAAGEYTSVASQRDLLARQVAMEKREIDEAPEEEAAELVLIFKQKGLSTEQASRTAAELRLWQQSFPTEKISGQLTLMYARYWAGRLMFDQAIALSEQLLTVNPDSPYMDQLLMLAAACEVKRGKNDRALATLHSLVKDYPGSPLAPAAKEQIAKLESGGAKPVAPPRKPARPASK